MMADFTQIKVTAAEFLSGPETNKIVELINEEIIVAPSPVDPHQEAAGSLYMRLARQVKSGKWRFAPMDVYLDEANVVQPDIFWVSDDNPNCHLADGKYWRGAPDFVVEILSPGTTRQDRHVKYALYEKHGVREYWIVDAAELYIEVYALRDGRFERLGVFGLGEPLKSSVLGQTFNVDALLKS
ncbi:MAG TPA: Uma2 family endonuclease [Phototrophicaceae bacterium]|nr:Uma2 family endonuclease [Phototrophicaceae bacterium]